MENQMMMMVKNKQMVIPMKINNGLNQKRKKYDHYSKNFRNNLFLGII
jgi:hypothetical protein